MTAALPELAATAGALAAGIVDARTGFIPNAITRAALFAALALALLRGDGLLAAAGAACCGGSLVALHALTRGRGIGLGDGKLAAVVGAGFGPAGGAFALAAAFVVGAMLAVWLLATRRARRGERLAFGPFIAAGALLALLARTAR